MHVAVVALFAEQVVGGVAFGVSGRAVERGLLRLDGFNPRDYARDRHRTVDDRPYGGGPGMVMKVEPLRSAIRAASAAVPGGSPVVLLSAQGRRFDQARAEALAREPGLVLVAGRYEGVDERLVAEAVDEELSIGDFVLSGGELGAMVVIDCVARLLPGVLGDAESAVDDSFATGLLEGPQYTRPEEIDGVRVPEVLLSGDHEAVRRWRLKQALGRTWQRRPDLLWRAQLDDEERRLLAEFIEEFEG